jgi:hypothetical protein
MIERRGRWMDEEQTSFFHGSFSSTASSATGHQRDHDQHDRRHDPNATKSGPSSVDVPHPQSTLWDCDKRFKARDVRRVLCLPRAD